MALGKSSSISRVTSSSELRRMLRSAMAVVFSSFRRKRYCITSRTASGRRTIGSSQRNRRTGTCSHAAAVAATGRHGSFTGETVCNENQKAEGRRISRFWLCFLVSAFCRLLRLVLLVLDHG